MSGIDPRRPIRDFFFYGTLTDDDVLTAVLRRPARLARSLARVAGYRCVHRRAASYPILVSAPSARAEGVLVSGLDRRDLRRLLAFEGREYTLARVTAVTETGEPRIAAAFLPKPSVPGTRRPWHFTDWRRRWKKRDLERMRARGRFAV